MMTRISVSGRALPEASKEVVEAGALNLKVRKNARISDGGDRGGVWEPPEVGSPTQWGSVHVVWCRR